MPRYDFRCKECSHTFTVTYVSVGAVDENLPQCPECGANELSRLIKRVNLLTSEDRRLENLADPSRLAGLDEEDPRAVGKMMRDMANELGEDPGEEFNEVVDRLEAGESPESIEQSMDISGMDDI